MFRIEIHAATVGELHEKLSALQPAGSNPLANASTESLLEELRTRFRPQGLVVNVESFAAEPEPDAGPAPVQAEPEKKARKPRESKAEATGPAVAALKEAAKAVQPETATAQAMAADGPSKADVVKALETYAAANGGQVAARKVMQDVGGGTTLASIPTEKWGDLIAALTVKEAA